MGQHTLDAVKDKLVIGGNYEDPGTDALKVFGEAFVNGLLTAHSGLDVDAATTLYVGTELDVAILGSNAMAISLLMMSI